jgi:DNA polymerase-3 subunit delta
MPGASFDAVFRALRKGDVPPVLYLHGPEHVLKEELIADLLDRVLEPSLRDFNLDHASANDLDPEQVETLCHTVPMMAERRVVIVREVEAWSRRPRARAAMLRYLARPSPETVLVLLQGPGAGPDSDLAAACLTLAAEPLPPERARKWLLLHAERSGIRLADDAALHLVRACDTHLGLLRTELAKLAGLAGQEPLTLERVAALLGVRHGETQYDWRDLVLQGETARALAVIPHVLAQSGMSGVALVTLLGTSLVGVGLARAHSDRGARGPALVQAVRRSLFRARPARVSYDAAAAEWSRLAPRWPVSRVDRALRLTLAADERLKSTSVSDEHGILVDLVLQLGLDLERAAA